MTTRLKLICHAPTSAVRASAFPADEPLEPRVLQRLAALSHRLHRADHYLTSPALRAMQTAEALSLTATIASALRDCDYGNWTGRSLEEVQAKEPEAVAEWLRNPAAAPHGGESIVALIERVAVWLEEMKATPGVTVAVTHASVIRAAIAAAIESGPRSFWRIDVAPLTLARLNGANGRWALVSLGPINSGSRRV
jgi:broad specificity phosphatase PhoE